jgi:hypothetical protein
MPTRKSFFAKLLEQHPDNVAVLLEVARLAAKTGDGATLQRGGQAVAGVGRMAGK